MHPEFSLPCLSLCLWDMTLNTHHSVLSINPGEEPKLPEIPSALLSLFGGLHRVKYAHFTEEQTCSKVPLY